MKDVHGGEWKAALELERTRGVRIKVCFGVLHQSKGMGTMMSGIGVEIENTEVWVIVM